MIIFYKFEMFNQSYYETSLLEIVSLVQLAVIIYQTYILRKNLYSDET
jgi:hypothetical protein